MKVNVFVPTRSGGKFTEAINYASITGEIENLPTSPEDAIISMIDEESMTEQEILLSRIKTFLGNRRLTMADVKNLPPEEQARLKKEFLEHIEPTSSSILSEKAVGGRRTF